MIGISTMCGNHKKIEKIVKKTNIFFAEVGFSDTKKDYLNNKKVFDNYGIPFLGVHSPALIPKKTKAASRFIDFVSDDEDIVKKSIKYLENSLIFASSEKMNYVIFHPGGCEEIGFEENLKEFLKIRRSKSEVYLYRFFKNFERFLKICENLNIKIGIETRFYPGEFPNFFELEKIFKEFDSKFLYYWHDLSHAYVRENIMKEPSYLKNFKNKLLGIHIHDIKGLDEHRPPGKGVIDFKKIFDEIKDVKNIYLVFEIDEKYKEEEIIDGIKKIERIIKIDKFVSREKWKPYKFKMEDMNFHLPERIIIHHTAFPSIKEYRGFETIRKIQAEHIKRGFSDIGYHFLIEPEGKIIVGRNIYFEGAHTKSKNKKSVGIALIGNFEEEKPTKKQINSLKKLIFILKRFFNIKKIKMHKDYNKDTLCPGKNLEKLLSSNLFDF
jgi:sugar phosphate isomerase/epimerase